MTPSIYLAVCVSDFIHVDTTICLTNLFRYAPCRMIFHRGSMVPRQRQKAAEDFLSTQDTHLLFIDSDMTFPADVIPRLLAHDKPVVACDYRRRVPPHDCVTTWGEGPVPTSGLVPAVSLATGVMLIECSVFSKLSLPYFNYFWNGKELVTEDTYFSYWCAQAGIPLFVDLDLSREVGHLASIPVKLGNVFEQ